MDNQNLETAIEERHDSHEKESGPTVVGVGASAGGLAALKRLFEHVPADSGLAFVVVVHLSPEHKSHLADLLQASVRFPVRQVTETTALEPNHVYVIPPNANLSAIDTHLRLSKLEEHRRERAPIDHFFRTLAATHDGHGIGVILTGTGSDGTLGLKEIKAKGGLIIVQDPNEAEFDGMPQSAIATGLVDRVLPLNEIPETLLRFARTEPQIPTAVENNQAEHAQRVILPKVTGILRTRTDRDFSRYKPATLLRRIARRMQLNYIEDFDRYLEKLREQPEEARALGDDLLITVTSFFRDPDVFAKLEHEVIPRLFDGKGPQDSIRVWTVGCATGEEAYSIAMLLLEEAARRDSSPEIQIFASDLHKRSLNAAREGVYPGDITTDVSEERLRRFFHKENGAYRICKELRDVVVFAPHNLLGDPPFSRVHLITCRNLLIYLDRSVQRDVVDLFHYALRPDGYLVLGSAESVEDSELFRTEDKKLCLFRKRNVPAPEPRLPVFPHTRIQFTGEPLVKPEQAAIAYGSLHQNLLEKFAAGPTIDNGDRLNAAEMELNITRQRLQAVIEEYETSQEEMKAANEEMQSSNEELRSTMEELETSKEELQSINEELQTVNQENRHKVEELSQLSSDLQNLLAATNIATLFLDRDLRILRFTPQVAELFSVRATDRGRPISDLTHRLGYQQLRDDAQTVLNRLIPIKREIQDDSGKWYLTRVLPYRSTEDRIEGVVITFIEITRQKRAELALRESEEQLRSSLTEKEALLKEVHHRVKNNLQVITSLLNLQARQIQDQTMLGFFEEARNRVQSIASIHEVIYKSDSFAAVDLGAYVCRLVPEVVRLYGAQERIQVVLEESPVSMELHRAVPFGLLLNELVSNVCKHAFADGSQGSLTVRLEQEDGDLVLTVSDTGIGLPKGFHYEQGESLGVYLVRTLARQLRATVRFETGPGTTVRVRLPLQRSVPVNGD